MNANDILIFATDYAAVYGHLVYWVVALGSFMEAIPFSGLLVPGNIMLAIAGILAYEGYLWMPGLLFLAIIGAVLGDLAAYYIGMLYNGKQKLIDVESKNHYPLKRKYLEKADNFCQKHGGKGVFFGRFIGPMRPFVAFIAGIGHMPFASFMFYNAASAVLWAVGFLFLGYFVEGSLKLISRIEHIIVLGILVIATLYLIKYFFKKEVGLEKSKMG